MRVPESHLGRGGTRHIAVPLQVASPFNFYLFIYFILGRGWEEEIQLCSEKNSQCLWTEWLLEWEPSIAAGMCHISMNTEWECATVGRPSLWFVCLSPPPPHRLQPPPSILLFHLDCSPAARSSKQISAPPSPLPACVAEIHPWAGLGSGWCKQHASQSQDVNGTISFLYPKKHPPNVSRKEKKPRSH